MAALLGLPLQAQTDGPRGLALFSLAAPRTSTWRLVVEGRPFFQAQLGVSDARWARLVVVGLQTEAAGSGRIAALMQGSGLDEPRTQWVLLDPGGALRASGAGLPDLNQVEEALRKGMGALPWDTLEALLQAHPDQGEARLAMAELALALSAPWHFRDPRPMARYEAWLPAGRTLLEKLLSVPEWPWQVDLASEPVPESPRAPMGAPEIRPLERRHEQAGVSRPEPESKTTGRGPTRLGSRLRGQAPKLQDYLLRMAQEVVDALASDTDHARLQVNLAFLIRILESESAQRLMGEIDRVEPLPGQAWPPLPLIHAQTFVLRRMGKWEELKYQALAWSRGLDRLFLDPGAWQRHLLREATLKAYGAMARSWQEGWEILPGAFTELRGRAGSSYSELTRLVLDGAQLPPLPSKEREDLFKQAALPPLPAPAMPATLPPWRIEVRDPKDLPRLKGAFDTAPSLLQWLPSERLFALHPSQAQPWVLSLGLEPKGSRETLPLPEALGEVLAGGRPGRLWVASDRVGHQPDAPGPRRFRIGYLLQRMPCRALESMLAKDLSLARLGAELNREDLDENLWFTESQRAIPALEEHLRRWPMDGERWGALAFWTAFLPAHRGPAALADDLPPFQPGLSFRLSLPVSVHERVGQQLKRQKAWAALRAWFEPAWEGLRGLKPEGEALVRELQPTIQTYLDAAYANLGLSGQGRLLQEAGRELEGGKSQSHR